MRIKWLHISDIHFSYPGFDTILARRDLICHIQKVGSNQAFTDLFVTGDVLYRNAAPTEDTLIFLNEIIQAMKIPKTHVWIVPGNHDHDRNVCGQILQDIYTKEDTAHAVDIIDEENVVDLLKSFKTYCDFITEVYGKGIACTHRNLHWVSELQEKIILIGLNTAWLEFDSNSSQYIRIGLKHLPNIIISSGLGNETENIAIGHHPLDHLHPDECDHVLGLFQRNNIHTYLCGHKHGAGVKFFSDYNVLQIDAAGLLVDGFSYGGFSIGIIDSDLGLQKAEFYRWNLSKKYWRRDGERNGVNVDGVCNFELIRQDRKPENIAIDLKLLNGPIPEQEIQEILNDKKAEIIKFQTHSVDGSISNEQWASLRNELLDVFNFVNSNRANKRVNIFPMAPLPLLVEMGFLFQHNFEMLIWQYDRSRDKWLRHDNCSGEYKLMLVENRDRNYGKLIVSVATSVEIFQKQINQVISLGENDSLIFQASTLNVGYPLDADYVEKFSSEIVGKVRSIIGMYDEVHLFLAVPAGLAVEIGRGLQMNMFPPINLYHYHAGYKYAYTINNK